MSFNNTTPNISPLHHHPGPPASYILTLFALALLIGCVAAVAVYLRRKSRLDELRLRLIPLYRYDPAEERDWMDPADGNEDQELTEPLYKEGKLSFSTEYGTEKKRKKIVSIYRKY